MLQTMRTLMELTSSDVDKIKLYEEAKQLLAGLPSNAYPDRELQWLVTSCWNKGAHQAKFQRFEAAVQYMRLALALLEHCHSLSARKQVGSEKEQVTSNHCAFCLENRECSNHPQLPVDMVGHMSAGTESAMPETQHCCL